MNMKNKLKVKKLVSFVSLGSLILGVFFISWAMIHIQGETETVTATVAVAEIETEIATVAETETASKAETVVVAAISTPNTDEVLYPIRPLDGDTIGNLTIPALKQILPIIHGTDEDELERGIGHFSRSVLPGENNNSVLSGHRDTVFARLGELEIGDTLIVETSAGIFNYKISAIRIVDKDDLTIIVPTDHAVLTVSTCYPFSFIGAAPDRYILTADLM